MIPIYKLKALPRSQKLRKAASLVRNGEHRLLLSGRLAAGEAEYFYSLVEFLLGEGGFGQAAAEALKAAEELFKDSEFDGVKIRRALGTVYHVLLNETGRNQADWDFIEASGTLDASMRRPIPGMQVYLEDIRSPFNVGSMFRAAESFGAEKLWLSPLCADPNHKRALRTAMGCVEILPWERSPLESLEGPFFALETGGTPLGDFSFPARGILIAGSEELGVSPGSLAAADASLGRVTIPTRGAKGSLNVSVAFGIVMQAWASSLPL
jgi:TrmH family RNA methyltransferase